MSGPPWPVRWQRLLRALTLVHGEAGRQQLLDWLEWPAGPHVVAFANAHGLNLAARDAAFAGDLLAADTLLRDGVGVAMLMALAGRRPGLNLNGTDLIPRLLQRQAGERIALLGTREPWLSRARVAVEDRLAPGSHCVTEDGFRPVHDYLRIVRSHRPRLVLLAMGMPRQEAVARALRAELRHPCLIVCGGAILDFLAGRVARAPGALQRSGLEWAWRLACEPRRLFGRYVVGNPVFLARALQCAYLDLTSGG